MTGHRGVSGTGRRTVFRHRLELAYTQRVRDRPNQADSDRLEADAGRLRAAPAQIEPPPYYQEYLHDGGPLNQEAFNAKLQAELERLDAEMSRLNHEAHGKDAKIRKRAQRELKRATNQRTSREQEWLGQYRKVLEYWTQFGSTTTTVEAAAPRLLLASHEEKGEDSWMKLAHWIAENGND